MNPTIIPNERLVAALLRWESAYRAYHRAMNGLGSGDEVMENLEHELSLAEEVLADYGAAIRESDG